MLGCLARTCHRRALHSMLSSPFNKLLQGESVIQGGMYSELPTARYCMISQYVL